MRKKQKPYIYKEWLETDYKRALARCIFCRKIFAIRAKTLPGEIGCPYCGRQVDKLKAIREYNWEIGFESYNANADLETSIKNQISYRRTMIKAAQLLDKYDLDSACDLYWMGDEDWGKQIIQEARRVWLKDFALGIKEMICFDVKIIIYLFKLPKLIIVGILRSVDKMDPFWKMKFFPLLFYYGFMSKGVFAILMAGFHVTILNMDDIKDCIYLVVSFIMLLCAVPFHKGINEKYKDFIDACN